MKLKIHVTVILTNTYRNHANNTRLPFLPRYSKFA